MEKPRTSRRLGEILRQAGIVREADLDEAVAEARARGERLGAALIRLGKASEDDIGWALSRQLQIPFVHVRSAALDWSLTTAFPEGLLRRHNMVPLLKADGKLFVAMADPTDAPALASIGEHAGCAVSAVVALESAVDRALDDVFGASGAAAPAPRVPGRTGRPETALLDEIVGPLLDGRATSVRLEPHGAGTRLVYVHAWGVTGTAVRDDCSPAALLPEIPAVATPAARGILRARRMVEVGDQHVSLQITRLPVLGGVYVLHASGERDGSGGIAALAQPAAVLEDLKALLATPLGLVLATAPSCSLRTLWLRHAARTLAAGREVWTVSPHPYPPHPRLYAVDAAEPGGWHDGGMSPAGLLAAEPGAMIVDAGWEAARGAVAAAAGRLVIVGGDALDPSAAVAWLLRAGAPARALAGVLRGGVHARALPGDPPDRSTRSDGGTPADLGAPGVRLALDVWRIAPALPVEDAALLDAVARSSRKEAGSAAGRSGAAVSELRSGSGRP